MKLGEVFRFELAYRLRSPSTWVYAGVPVPHRVLDASSPTGGRRRGARQRAARLARASRCSCGLFGMLVTAALFGDAAIRDVAAGMDPLLFTSPAAQGRIPRRPLPRRAGDQRHRRCSRSRSGSGVATLMPYLDAASVRPVPPRGVSCSRCCSSCCRTSSLIGAILFTIGGADPAGDPGVPRRRSASSSATSSPRTTGAASTNPLLSALADPLGINALLAMTAVLDGGGAERAADRLPGDAGVEPRCSGSRSRRRVLARAAPHGSASRTRDGGGRARRARRRAGRRAAGSAAAGAVPQRPRRRSGSRTRVRQTLAVARQLAGGNRCRAARFSWSSLARDRPRAALGLERRRHASSTRRRGRSRISSRRRCCRQRRRPSFPGWSSRSSRASWCGRTARSGAARDRRRRAGAERRRAARPLPGARRACIVALPGRVHGRRHAAAGAAGLLRLRARPVPPHPLRAEPRRLRPARRARDDGPRAREPQVPRPHRRAAGDRRSRSSPRCSGSAPPARLQQRPGLDVLGHERLRPVRRAVRLVQALLGGVGAAARGRRDALLGARAGARACAAARASRARASRRTGARWPASRSR